MEGPHLHGAERVGMDNWQSAKQRKRGSGRAQRLGTHTMRGRCCGCRVPYSGERRHLHGGWDRPNTVHCIRHLKRAGFLLTRGHSPLFERSLRGSRLEWGEDLPRLWTPRARFPFR